MRKRITAATLVISIIASAAVLINSCSGSVGTENTLNGREYNSLYTGKYNNRVAFPIGGMGAGMFCLEGNGGIAHFSVRNKMDFFNKPCMFAAIYIKGDDTITKVLEGQVQDWRIFGDRGTGNGASGTNFGLPRFREASFLARFPFGMITLEDPLVPLEISINGWSPFIPGNADDSSLPVGALEYHFKNNSGSTIESVFSYSTKNFLSAESDNRDDGIKAVKNGFVLVKNGTEENPEEESSFAVFTDQENTTVDHSWFKGGWWDPLTMAWNNISSGKVIDNPPQEGSAPGASLYVPLSLDPGEEKTIRVMFAWYVPNTTLRFGPTLKDENAVKKIPLRDMYEETDTYVPWYAGRFESIFDISNYWSERYDDLRRKTHLFTETFYDTTLPDVVVEAVAANLTILKSPTVLRQTDGRLWCFEGCTDGAGCCHGSCTHVWNYAQAIPHLFPELERSLRETEFTVSQDERGHQTFRASLPIRPPMHDFHAASDGQLGGIMKAYREWRISGDTPWLESIWPKIIQSLDYCIAIWDPKGKGVLEEPHHNTYDIEFWGPDGMCTSFYLGALKAAIEIGTALGDDVSRYQTLLDNGRKYLETELYNGEYFYQDVQWEGLETEFEPVDYAANGTGYKDAVETLNSEGPKYQYGTGCISDGVLGFWLARMCGLGEIVDSEKVKSHLKAVHKYNLKKDLTDHANPQRPSFALGGEGGLLLCTWPRGGKLTLPFVYSDEVWTGIEYQVSSHLMLEGMVEEGLDIVSACRDRYDGSVRNPFNEYECGHWYARAMASYGLIQGLTGARYDALDKTLFIDSNVGDSFRAFLSTESGFGTVGLDNGKPFLDMKNGTLDVRKVIVSGEETDGLIMQ
ncbi:GH116 family glycosyl hydrolase [Candidatus Latescibacterota bacterium]